MVSRQDETLRHLGHAIRVRRKLDASTVLSHPAQSRQICRFIVCADLGLVSTNQRQVFKNSGQSEARVLCREFLGHKVSAGKTIMVRV